MSVPIGYIPTYGWLSYKPTRKQHLLLGSGGTLCKLENQAAGFNLDRIAAMPHPTRAVCSMCRAVFRRMTGAEMAIADDGSEGLL